MRIVRYCAVAIVLAATSPANIFGQQQRPPAVPLIANDPSFSLWSMYDNLTDGATKHWSEAPQPFTGLVRIDGQPFRWMGGPARGFRLPDVKAMQQTSVEVTPLHSRYRFVAAGVELRVTFFTPLFPQDLDVMSRPVTYLTWGVASVDRKPHKVDLLLDVDPAIAVTDAAEQVTWSRSRVPGLAVLSTGTRDQAVLNRSGDRIRIDWGYFHVAVPNSEPSVSALTPTGVAQFAASGNLDDADDLSMPRPAGGSGLRAAHLAVELHFGTISETLVERHVVLAYTDNFSIEYLERRLRGYWQRKGMTEAELLAISEKQYPELEARGIRFDAALTADMRKVGGGLRLSDLAVIQADHRGS